MDLSNEQSEEKLVETVKAVRSTLQRLDSEKANDATEITQFMQDEANHVAMKDVDEESVEKALEVVREQEKPLYVAPEGTYPIELLFSGIPLRNLEDFTQYRPVGIHHAQGGLGSKGSYIIACKLDANPSIPSLFVLKESNPSTPSEMFASAVMRKMGLISPKFHPLSLGEFEDLTSKLHSAQVTVEGTCAALHDQSVQGSGGVLMEFLSGKTLPECNPKAFSRQEVLRDVGRCMAVDMALNCLDRIPIIWNNNGNPTNLLVTDDEIHVIDSAYNRILHEDAAKERLEKVKECVREVKSCSLGEHAESVRKFLHDATGGRVSLDDGQLRQVFSALGKACDELAMNHESIFQSAAQETRDAFERSGCTEKVDLDETLQLDFCTECARAMQLENIETK
jgi:hypothetical protein